MSSAAPLKRETLKEPRQRREDQHRLFSQTNCEKKGLFFQHLNNSVEFGVLVNQDAVFIFRHVSLYHADVIKIIK